MDTLFLPGSLAFSICLGLNNTIDIDEPIIDGQKYYIAIGSITDIDSPFLSNIETLGYISYNIEKALNKIVGWVELKVNNNEEGTYIICNYGLFSSPLHTTFEHGIDIPFVKIRYIAPNVQNNEIIVSYGDHNDESIGCIRHCINFRCDRKELEQFLINGILSSEVLKIRNGSSVETYSVVPIREINDNISECESCVISYGNGLYDLHLVITGKID